MKKRLKKKSDKKLYRAIKELNEDILSEHGKVIHLSHASVMDVFNRIHHDPTQVSIALKEHKAYIASR